MNKSLVRYTLLFPFLKINQALILQLYIKSLIHCDKHENIDIVIYQSGIWYALGVMK